MVFESILIHFGHLSHQKGFFSNLGQRTLGQIRGSDGHKWYMDAKGAEGIIIASSHGSKLNSLHENNINN